MGKHEPLSAKAIGKKIKAAGLQKLRWYCQMCEKQCRDANGFKCHIESEGHQRQIQIFGSNTGKFIDDFSRDFEGGFMDIVKRRFRHTRVLANIVYNEYIRDRNHIHLNATRWVTLTGFVTYLGKSGKCKVEESPKGWYLTYIERDPDALAKEEKLKRKAQEEQDEETRILQEMEKRSKLAAGQAPISASAPTPSELQSTDLKINFSLGKTEGTSEDVGNENQNSETKTTTETPVPVSAAPAPTPAPTPVGPRQSLPGQAPQQTKFSLQKPSAINVFNSAPKKRDSEDSKEKGDPKKAKKMSAMEAILMEEFKKKEKLNRRDYWLCENIIVKVMNKDLADGRYYKQKGVVISLEDQYVGLIKMIDSGDMLKLDQSQLETVIPTIGGKVKVVNGAYRGEEATVNAVNFDKFCATVKIETGLSYGNVVEIQYEDISKVNVK